MSVPTLERLVIRRTLLNGLAGNLAVNVGGHEISLKLTDAAIQRLLKQVSEELVAAATVSADELRKALTSTLIETPPNSPPAP